MSFKLFVEGVMDDAEKRSKLFHDAYKTALLDLEEIADAPYQEAEAIKTLAKRMLAKHKKFKLPL